MRCGSMAASAAMIPQFQERLEKRLSQLLGETPIEPAPAEPGPAEADMDAEPAP